MTSRPDAKVVVRRRDGQFSEEDVTHRVVVVLAGVDENLVVALAEDLGDGKGLHELWSRTDDGENAHVFTTPSAPIPGRGAKAGFPAAGGARSSTAGAGTLRRQAPWTTELPLRLPSGTSTPVCRAVSSWVPSLIMVRDTCDYAIRRIVMASLPWRALLSHHRPDPGALSTRSRSTVDPIPEHYRPDPGALSTRSPVVRAIRCLQPKPNPVSEKTRTDRPPGMATFVRKIGL